MGRGLIEPVDELMADTEASNPELMKFLEGEEGSDIMFRRIMPTEFPANVPVTESAVTTISTAP